MTSHTVAGIKLKKKHTGITSACSRAVTKSRQAAPALFHELFHLLRIGFSLLTTKLLHHLKLIFIKVLFAAAFHKGLHFFKVWLAIFPTTLFHHFIHRHNPLSNLHLFHYIPKDCKGNDADQGPTTCNGETILSIREYKRFFMALIKDYPTNLSRPPPAFLRCNIQSVKVRCGCERPFPTPWTK